MPHYDVNNEEMTFGEYFKSLMDFFDWGFEDITGKEFQSALEDFEE